MRALALQLLQKNAKELDAPMGPHDAVAHEEIFQALKALESNDFENLAADEKTNANTLDKFSTLFRTLSQRGTVWMVIDGLDEYDFHTSKLLMKFLACLCKTRGILMRVLLFSRPEEEIRWAIENCFVAKSESGKCKLGLRCSLPPQRKAVLRSTLPRARQEALTNSVVTGQKPVPMYHTMAMPSTRSDVFAFATHQVAMIVRAKHPNSSEHYQHHETERIVGKLLTTQIDNQSPIFLWVARVIDIMKHPGTTVSAMEALLTLKYLPNALYTVYARIITRIEMMNTNQDDFLDFLRGVLCWAVYSKQKPLQMSTMLVIAKGKLNAEQIREKIDRYCSSLFVWRSQAGSDIKDALYFIHLSVMEFLSAEETFRQLCSQDEFPIFKKGEFLGKKFEGRLIFTKQEAHRRIFDDCITYLSDCPSFRKALVSTRGDAVRRDWVKADYPFFAYAALYWQHHLGGSGHCEAQESARQLQEFLHRPNRDTWIEGAIALGDGVEELRNQNRVIESWLAEQNQESTSFRNWTRDVTGSGFEDYDTTLRYNPNDIHFLDCKSLFSHLVEPEEYIQPQRDALCRLVWNNKEKAPPDSNSVEQSDKPKHMKAGSLFMPAHRFPYGENDEECGFVGPDRNRSPNQGIFLIDKRVNDPRLSWYCMKPPAPPKHLDKTAIAPIPHANETEPIRLESLTTEPTKVDGHMFWSTLSADVNWSGSAVAAVFAETVRTKDGKKAYLRVKPVVWEFCPAEGDADKWRVWEAQAKASRRKLVETTQNALDVLHSPANKGTPACNSDIVEMLDAVADARKAFQDAFKSRPMLPTAAPLYEGQKWVTCKPLYDKKVCDEYPWTDDTILQSRYLVAFREDGCLINYRGIWDVRTGEYSRKYRCGLESTAGFVVVPGGDDILRIRRAAGTNGSSCKATDTDVLEIIDPDTEELRDTTSASSLGPYDRFGALVDCSESGRLVAVTLESDTSKTISLAVLDLYQYTYKVIVHDKSTDCNFKFHRVFFCPADTHAVVTHSRRVIEQQSGAYLIDLPRGTCSEVNVGDRTIAAILYSHCKTANCFPDISGLCLRGPLKAEQAPDVQSSDSLDRTSNSEMLTGTETGLNGMSELELMFGGRNKPVDCDEYHAGDDTDSTCCSDQNLCDRNGHIHGEFCPETWYFGRDDRCHDYCADLRRSTMEVSIALLLSGERCPCESAAKLETRARHHPEKPTALSLQLRGGGRCVLRSNDREGVTGDGRGETYSDRYGISASRQQTNRP